ncbi:MAG: isoleucine--tRNA ligase [Geminicoccaceae bacterium]
MTTDYRTTVFLPKTDFPMKANLPQREPAILDRWAELDLYARLREAAAGRAKFILHDGPPYANGHLHMGHALNKVLKDVINRNQQMLGKDAAYVPGWDCHGLPIEWQIEQQYRKKGKNKDDVPIVALRKECRAFADKWIDVQTKEFKRLGVEGDFKNPYTTMAYQAEAGIFRELAKFLLNGSLYRGKKSVMWSVVEKTALAEAEVEYYDHTSTTIYVRFPIHTPSQPVLAGVSAVIWTTTPWTMPANRAMAFGGALNYQVIEVGGTAEGAFARPGEKLLLATELVETVCQDAGITSHNVLASLKGGDIAGSVAAHPWRGDGYDFDVPLLAGDFVTTEQGTGIVHIAPSHGADDFELGARHGLDVPDTVNEDGTYADWLPKFAGIHVFKAAEPVVEALQAAGALLASGKLVHSYPHSWRSKAPLIFRATPQWFIPMDGDDDLRGKALRAIDDTRFVPTAGQRRLRSMIEARPDWCVSRQRAWGVPIAIFVNKQTGEPLRDPAVCERVAQAFEAEGADAWFDSPKQRFLGNDYDPDAYEQVTDILDVWFDSGSTHATVLEQRPELQWPASLYLEGSDQHRGWFHSSLLESCGTRGRAPYEAVLTHGFVVDGSGRKMSKSLGNVIAPEDIMKTKGADILRLWVVSADYAEDLRISEEILSGQADAYRRVRNTFRFLLGNLAGFSESERLAYEDMPELEQTVLARLAELDGVVRAGNDSFNFPQLYGQLITFCNVGLSAHYFDIRKDCLYCDRIDSVRRRACRTVLDEVFRCLSAWFAPVLVFTMEEVWQSRFPNAHDSVHLRLFPDLPAQWQRRDLIDKWIKLLQIRSVVTTALEEERRAKRIGASLQAAPVLYVDDSYRSTVEGSDMAELTITSACEVRFEPPPPDAFKLEGVAGVAVVPKLAEGKKCARCWQILTEVGSGSAPDLCLRCDDAVQAAEAA